MKKYILGILVVTVLVIGVAVGILLVNQNQLFNQKASTPNGQTTVSLSPATASVQRNSPYTVSVNLNTAGVLISGLSIRLTYSNLAVKASNIKINSDLLATGDWACPIKSVISKGSTDQIDISCVYASTTGY